MPSDDGSILGKHTFEILDEGLREFSDLGDGITKWKGILAIKDNKDYIYSFTDNNVAHIIPKRSFSNEAECESFLNELKSRVPEKKPLRD
jgi:hypothetical protein